MNSLQPAPIWTAPPLYLAGLLVIASCYAAVGLEMAGRVVGGVLDASLGGFALDEGLTLAGLYATLIGLALFTVIHDSDERSPEHVA